MNPQALYKLFSHTCRVPELQRAKRRSIVRLVSIPRPLSFPHLKMDQALPLSSKAVEVLQYTFKDDALPTIRYARSPYTEKELICVSLSLASSLALAVKMFPNPLVDGVYWPPT